MIATTFLLFGVIMLAFSVIIAMAEIRNDVRSIAPPIFFWIAVAAFITAFFAWLPW